MLPTIFCPLKIGKSFYQEKFRFLLLLMGHCYLLHFFLSKHFMRYYFSLLYNLNGNLWLVEVEISVSFTLHFLLLFPQYFPIISIDWIEILNQFFSWGVNKRYKGRLTLEGGQENNTSLIVTSRKKALCSFLLELATCFCRNLVLKCYLHTL